MAIETLTYESPQFLQKLVGHDLAGLRVVADIFGVHLTSRDSWVRIDGESAAVQATRDVFVQLEKVGRQGGDIFHDGSIRGLVLPGPHHRAWR